jgi:hypothetical protein
LAPVIAWVDGNTGDKPNALLYSCSDGAYDLDRLPKKSRRDVRRGLRSVEIRRIDFSELARLGYSCLVDTRTRNRAGVPTPSEFDADCRLRERFACQAAWGAFAGKQLCAWTTTHRVRDRVDLGGVAMLWEMRTLCASYALVYTVTRHALLDCRVPRVGYGLSSVQPERRAESLHQFKTWLGFLASPVRRRFELHPLAAALRAPWALELAQQILAGAPQGRAIRKLRGVLSLLRDA